MQETRIPIAQAFSKTPSSTVEVSNCAESEPFALQVTDDSMEPEFTKGCVIIIDPGLPAYDDAYVLARDNDGQYIFRQYRLVDGIARLFALKQGRPALSLTSPSQIEGVITQRSGARRKRHKHYV